ncbi:MAG: uroporphyrinogen-III synthase [Acidimicrobiales bacterium]|nr:uroporphyrinogen-III synthase [Acidimicrobiia bacterium]NNF56510.1 uroporphyrinogen-III synthase [Acidimicrobiales bacterium]
MASGELLRLGGVTVLTCRQKGRGGDLHSFIREAGGIVVHLPLIEVVAPADGGAALRSALVRLDDFDWMVCTSANGVEAVARGLLTVGRELPSDLRLAAVGPATAATFSRLLDREPDLVPERATAADLGQAFPLSTQRVLAALAAAAGDDVKQVLRARGYSVEVVTAYDTQMPVHSPDLVRQAGTADVAVVSSPSAVRRLIDVLEDRTPGRIVAIGPKTAAAARNFTAARVWEARDTSAAGLMAALAQAT